MSRRLLLLIFGCLAAAYVSVASASPPDAGDTELMLQSGAVFTNGSTTRSGTAYYDTSNSHTDYNFAAGFGFGLGGDFEAGFSVGYGRLSTAGCDSQSCSIIDSVGSRQWSLFLRHNFESAYDGTNYAFSGIEFTAAYPDEQFGRITMLRPYVGYRFGLPQDWSLELVVGGSQVVAGTAAVSSGYEVRLGLVIPLQ
ncbi:MAG TPA: hypothetical protein VF117_04935 [Gammaproteobacteria bacterium]